MDNVYFRSGCTLFDMVVGGAKDKFGFPAGKFINIVGDRSSGKTFLANEMIAWAYHNLDKNNFKWVYDDCESGYSFDTESMFGFNVLNDESKHSTTVEEAFCNIADFANKLKDNQYGIYVLDSLDALTSTEQNERADERIKSYINGKNYDKGSYNMTKQKYLSQEFFPQLCSKIENKNILVIIVSQIRENIDMFSFEKYTRSGGKALDFYAYAVVWLATCKKIERKGVPIGVVVKAKTTKLKAPRPFRECFFSFLYDYGLDTVGTNIDYLFDLRTSTGDLNVKAKLIQWDNDNKNTLTELNDFLNENNIMSAYVRGRYYNKSESEIENIMNFIQSKKEHKEKYNERFGQTMNRDDLICYIEENNLEDELERKVITKWESFESSLQSQRKKRYGTIE